MALSNNVSEVGPPWDINAHPPMNTLTFNILEIIVSIILTSSLAFMGVLTNMINIVVFYRQGILSDSNNLSFTGLAISDLFCCLFALYSNVLLCIMKFFNLDGFKWKVEDFYIHSCSRPKTIFVQITCWLTAYIAMERFVSVVFPFQVKSIFTPRRSLLTVCGLFLLIFALYYPQYLDLRPEWIEYPEFNISILEYVHTKFITRKMQFVFLLLCPVTLRIISMTIVLLCNMTILWKVKLSSQFRKSSTMTTNTPTFCSTISNSQTATTAITKNTADAKSNKDSSNKQQKEQKLLRMVTLICVVFLICFTPNVFLVIIFYVMDVRLHFYAHETAYAFSYLLETINASTNLFIYYSMSTRYRQELQICLGKRKLNINPHEQDMPK